MAVRSETNRFLIYMPWEQINNQLVEFKSACAVASILDRVLVLPLIGHRVSVLGDADWDFSFRIPDFHWKPFENYFDPATYGELPCKTISNHNFRSFHAASDNFTLGDVYFNPIAKATSHNQIVEYFSGELGFDLALNCPQIPRWSCFIKIWQNESTEEVADFRIFCRIKDAHPRIWSNVLDVWI